ncbi:MAG TPA: ATP-binding cassette domain-containing protein [Nocardioidaceae bacterium]|nr:ATP-binding cassette domain-containing protein [Nocardioidaceae bacterium]
MTVHHLPDGRPSVIAVEGLTKRYGDQVAVDNLSLDVPRGVVAGFLGPNGAGKTTTMAMLLGLARPTAGRGTVLEFPLDRPTAYLGRVGALIEGPTFWPGLTGIENLRVIAKLSGHDTRQIPELLDLVRLSGRGSDRFGQYSLGMKQRLGIAAALIGDPELLVLDEPTNGLDPAGINEMRALIGDIAHDDRTVLVSSHLLAEVEQVCDWLIVIDHGALRYQGPADGFLGQVSPVLTLASERPDDLDRLVEVVRTAGFDAARERDGITVPLNVAEPRDAAVALNKEAISAGIVLAELHVQRPNLESHYLAMVEGGDR